MRVGVAATPDVAIPTLNWLIKSEHELALVITTPSKPAGRGRQVQSSPVAQWGLEHKVKIIAPSEPQRMIDEIAELDLVITIGYGVLLPEEVLKVPTYGFINLHFSLLPLYRGAAPAQRSLENGDLISGVTVFRLDKGMDTGPIFVQKQLAIDPEWRSKELLYELSLLGVKAIEESLAMISHGLAPVAQQGEFSLAPKISKVEAKIDFSNSAQQIVNRIRAFTYEPGAWTIWKGEPFKITKASIGPTIDLQEGAISFTNSQLLVGCKNSTSIQLQTVVPAGKQEMLAADWARGARLQGGENFG